MLSRGKRPSVQKLRLSGLKPSRERKLRELRPLREKRSRELKPLDGKNCLWPGSR